MKKSNIMNEATWIISTSKKEITQLCQALKLINEDVSS